MGTVLLSHSLDHPVSEDRRTVPMSLLVPVPLIFSSLGLGPGMGFLVDSFHMGFGYMGINLGGGHFYVAQ